MSRIKVKINVIEIEAEDTETRIGDLMSLAVNYAVDIYKNHYLGIVDNNDDGLEEPGTPPIPFDWSIGGMIQ